MTLLYRAGRRVWRVRALMWFSLAVAVWAVWGGAGLSRTYGSRPADGDVLKPLPVRLAFGGGIMLLGLAFGTGMLVYSRCYAARIEQNRDGRLVVTTVGWCGITWRRSARPTSRTAASTRGTSGRPA